MHHSLPLITTVALAFALALLLGFMAVRLKLPALVGYLLAGVVIGPFTPGLFADVSISQELAEIGVMLLMFGVGLHFSLEDLSQVRSIAIPGAIVQMLVATMLGGSVAYIWGWSLGSSLIFGLSLSVASTVVLLRALEERGDLESISGRIAVGWLLVEDLAMVVILVLIPPLSHSFGHQAMALDASQPLWAALTLIIVKVIAFVILMLVLGRRLFPMLLWQIAKTGSRELFTLCIIAAAVSIAYGAAKLFGVSFALGAFFAGMILRESSFSHRAAEESLPLRDAFAVLFFVSVGMLFNPVVLTEHPLTILSVVAIIILGKSIAAFLIVLLFRYPLSSALVVSVSLAQIGEFSFILAELGIRVGMLPVEGRSYILAGALISIALNPLLFKLVTPLQMWLSARVGGANYFRRIAEDPLAMLPTTVSRAHLSNQVVLVGYGRVGKRVTQQLMAQQVNFVIIDANRAAIEQLRADNIPAVYGDAAEPSALIQAHITHASLLLMLTSDMVQVRRMLKCAYTLNPKIEVVIRTHSEDEAALLKREVVGKVFFAEAEIASNIGHYVLQRLGKLF